MGLIQTPSADSRPEGTIAFTFNKNDIWKLGTISVSPFDWLEASYFYYRPSDLIWEGDLIAGHYLDKGFNIKFLYRPKNKNLPNLALGLDDFAGTGYFTREYLVATSTYKKIKISTGMGWGKFTGQNAFENPLKQISTSLADRPLISSNIKTGGAPTYDQWFRGDVSLFGGIEYFFTKPNSLKLKVEYDPYDYLDFSANKRPDAIYRLRKKDSNINIGLSYPINKYLNIDLSYIKGNQLNLSFNLAITFNDNLSKKPDFAPLIKQRDTNPTSKPIFYRELLNNLNNNRLLLQTSTLYDNGNLDIAISTADHRNSIRSSSYAAFIANKVANENKIDLGTITVSNINVGTELHNITYIANYFDENNPTPIEIIIRNSTLKPGEPDGFLDDEFKPKIEFPVIFSSISPTLVSHIGNPEKFFFGGINLQHVSEVQFSRNLLLTSELNTRIYGEFNNTITGPDSEMQHVRTDIVEYLKEDDLFISRMQVDYIFSPYKHFFAKLSGGIFENMYGGLGGEVLYKPFFSNFSIGANLFYVKQRDFKQRFGFRDYKTTTGHINFSYKFRSGIESNISYGRYLAKDDGFTFDLSRTTKSGFKSGVYFTRTDVPSEVFGEGSFDKGFYFQIPLDLLANEYKGNYSTVKISPLTRDGGAKLIYDKELKGLIYNSSYSELMNQWSGYLD